MTRKLTLFFVCAFEIALILIAVSSRANSSEPKLNKFEQEKFTETCFKTVQEAFSRGSSEYFDVSNGYSYFEPDLEKVHSGGADVSAVIKLTRIEKTGGNNGWGEAVSKKTYQYFECVFKSVPKGKYPAPRYFLRYYAKNSVNPWVVVHDSGSGEGQYGKCRPNVFGCIEQSYTWTPIDLAPEGIQYGNFGDKMSYHYQDAKQRAPKRWIWEQPFVAE